jgi:predicted nucleotidyltransferase
LKTIDAAEQPLIAEMLATMEDIFRRQGVEYYLVGAFARDIHLSKGPTYANTRRTKDIDIAIMLANEEEFYAVKEALLQTGAFTAHATETIKLFYQQRLEIDLLPFGEIENEKAETVLTKPQTFIMDVPGFKEAQAYVTTKNLDNGQAVNVCSLEGIILLKLFSWNDRKERDKDITDIETILRHYLELLDLEEYGRYANVLELYDTDDADNYQSLVGARIAGQKIRDMLKDASEIRQRIQMILLLRLDMLWQAIRDGMNDEEA